jgi:hypothetical protein
MADRSLLRWYPAGHLIDPYSALDLTTPWEQAWVARWVAEELRGDGAVVELGTWLGASSRAIGRGLRKNPSPQPPFHAYDTFVFDEIEARVAGTPFEGRLCDGASFRSRYEQRIGTVDVVVHEGDVTDASWDGGPIELLFVDLAKTWEVWRHVRVAFLAHVMVGGVVVQQDWAHANTPWLHLWHHRWRDHFECLGHVVHSGTVAFRLVEPLPAEAFTSDAPHGDEAAEVRDAFTWSAGLVHPNRRANVAAAHVMFHALHGYLDDAVDALLFEATRVPIAEELVTVAIPELARRAAAPRPPALRPPRPVPTEPARAWPGVAAKGATADGTTSER